jgi:hypothetical protein
LESACCISTHGRHKPKLLACCSWKRAVALFYVQYIFLISITTTFHLLRFVIITTELAVKQAYSIQTSHTVTRKDKYLTAAPFNDLISIIK